MVNNLPASAGDVRDVGSIPGSGRSPGGGHGNPLQARQLLLPGESHGQKSQSVGQDLSNLACTNILYAWWDTPLLCVACAASSALETTQGLLSDSKYYALPAWSNFFPLLEAGLPPSEGWSGCLVLTPSCWFPPKLLAIIYWFYFGFHMEFC